jgi:hypothetical protein
VPNHLNLGVLWLCCFFYSVHFYFFVDLGFAFVKTFHLRDTHLNKSTIFPSFHFHFTGFLATKRGITGNIDEF